ncbi:FAD-binding monooxygenase [Streptomyces pluripotens]|uniref:FAD-binding monooxygenase n=1 Tax=Streptomyces pluripotens TaxID=1355015 RepID=A0A221P609_9ACTN|nr:FAD-dependent monooxygenase [Streptomyces pluripotens]ARP73398.1 FAD-binding monooxygenase [Streptomyces pluripotens]ASN27647.1 FAD-binding monooxygenase [Streptomyces pluripotens]
MTQRTTVLVVGAGPCGLAMAAQLSRLGVEATVVDAEDHAHTGSRAILLWPPVREVLAELGLAERAAQDGVQPVALHYHLGSGGSVRVPLAEANAPLVLPQERTGRLLAEALADRGVGVQWGTRVTKVVQDEHTVTVTATRTDGSTTEIEADWVVGADGLRSQVRSQLGIDFCGARFPATFLLAEGRIAGEISADEVHYFLADTGVALIAPLPGGEFRISGAVPAGTEATAEHAQMLLDERGPGGLRFTEVRTVTLFSSDERVAGALRSGRCFLVGDAAHVHSPIGGQGLSLGIPDTRNLAWKLAGVVHGRLHDSVLDSYDPERRAAIAQTLQATGRMARQAVAGPVARHARDLVWRLLGASGGLARGYAPMLAGWRSRYPDVLFGGPAGDTHRSRPRPGTRDPSWLPKPSDGLAGRFQLITYGGTASQLAAAASELADQWPDLVAHFPLDGRTQRFVLLRPDGYVAASGDTDRFTGVAAKFAALVPTTPSPTATAR